MAFTELSDFGRKFCADSGILQLMDDLGRPLPEGMPSYQLGGGNPAQIPDIAALYRAEMQKIMLEGNEFDTLIARYDAPQGRTAFLETVAAYLAKTYGWNITAENVAVTNGSQSAFFYLFNLYSGRFSQGKNVRFKKIVLPLVPEYIGYADQALEPDAFVSIPSHVKSEGEHTFKYYVNFELLENYLSKHSDVGALAVSRPTNPSGNVLTDEEIQHLAQLARHYDIPLFVDNAYGLPWPNIIFTDATPYWDENVILSMSMSKIGLPALRTGIIVARKEVITAISNLNAIVALASGSLGQALAGPLIESGRLVQASRDIVRPFYEAKARAATGWIHQYFAGGDYAVHKSEGSIFQWLLLKDLNIPTKEFYQVLKARGVIVVPGEYFFFGNSDDGSTPRFETHPHYTKCLRLNYAREEAEVEQGLAIIAEEYMKHRA